MRKRTFDLLLLLPTAPLFFPLLGGLTLLVWLVDGRPVFFTQERAKKGGATFSIWKLRTMTSDDDVDARVPTRLGRWLRHHGLDELPQLLQVWQGHMSLVGPRPLKPDDVERLAKAHPAFRERLLVAPGLTGLAQITQVTGAQRTADVDAHYARRHSRTMDLQILLRTAWMNVVGKARGKAAVPAEVSGAAVSSTSTSVARSGRASNSLA